MSATKFHTHKNNRHNYSYDQTFLTWLSPEQNKGVFEHASLCYETLRESCNKATDVGKPRLRGRTYHCCAAATVHKQFKHTCVYTRLPVMGAEYKFFTTKKCNPNSPIINCDQWSLRLNFCLTLNSDGQAIFTGSRCTNEPRENIASRVNRKLYRVRQEKVIQDEARESYTGWGKRKLYRMRQEKVIQGEARESYDFQIAVLMNQDCKK